MTTVAPAARAPRTIHIGGHPIALVGPRVADPRLHVAAVVVTVQVLGQVVLDFDLSLTQILASLLTCALIELVVVLRRRRTLAWPASALLAGNGVALVLRVPGTQHGDWWSTRGLWIFVGTSALAMASRYLIRVANRPLFNPSNFALVACFLTLGPLHASPLDLWWANAGVPLTIAMAVIVVGGVALAFRVRMVGVVLSFWITLAVTSGMLALTGHAMTARWHVGPIEGLDYWILLLTSPEILVFLFFMITDPKTAPLGRVARAWSTDPRSRRSRWCWRRSSGPSTRRRSRSSPRSSSSVRSDPWSSVCSPRRHLPRTTCDHGSARHAGPSGRSAPSRCSWP